MKKATFLLSLLIFFLPTSLLGKEKTPCESLTINSNGVIPLIFCKNDNKTTLNILNIDYGPYDKLSGLIAVDNTNFGFRYENNDKKYFNINGKSYGPYYSFGEEYPSLNFISISGNSWAFVYKDKEGKYFVDINDKLHGPYGYVGKIMVQEDQWAYNYYNNDPTDGSTIINGKEYDFVSGGSFSISKNSWAYKYNDKNTEAKDFKVVYNGNEFGPYSLSEPKAYTPSGNSGNIYISDKNWIVAYNYDDGYQLIVNGEKYGPYDKYETGRYYKIFVNDNMWAFSYKIDGKEYFNINNTIYGPYDFTNYSFKMLENNWGLAFTNGEKSGVIINGTEYGPYDKYSIGQLAISDNNWGWRYKDNNKCYLNIHDEIYELEVNECYHIQSIKVSDNNYFVQYYKNGDISNRFIKTQKNEYGPSISQYSLFNNKLYTIHTNDDNKKYYTTTNDTSDITEPLADNDSITNYNITNNKKEQPNSQPTIQTINILTIKNTTMYSHLKGKIMLKVEDAGKAYYIHPQTQEMFYLGRPNDAFAVMREQGIGITTANLNKIPVGLDNLSGPDSDGDGLSDLFEDAIGTNKNKADSDGDGFNDKEELNNGYSPTQKNIKLNYDNNFGEKQKGRILLQVEGKGEAWYVNPENAKRYFLGRPSDAFQVMRNLGLGISNSDFDSM